MTKVPEVSIVIRCYNEERHIGRLLKGIVQQTVRNVEIILVDSGSTDATLAIASRYPVKIVSIRPEDFSFGYALNVGCTAARGEFLVFASGHVYPVFKDWIETLLEPFSDPRVALVYGKQRGNEVTKYSERRVFEKWFPEESDRDRNHPFCNNANAAVRRSVWEQLPYNKSLTGLEDIDWAKRALERGHKIAYVADAEIIHVHEETPRRVYERYRREAIALKHIFPSERFSLWDFLRLFTSNVVSDWYHAWHDRVLMKNVVEIIMFRLVQFWGTYLGYSQRGPVTDELRKTFYYPHSFRRETVENAAKDSEERRISPGRQSVEYGQDN